MVPPATLGPSLLWLPAPCDMALSLLFASALHAAVATRAVLNWGPGTHSPYAGCTVSLPLSWHINHNLGKAGPG